jgi:hypothetical protein
VGALLDTGGPTDPGAVPAGSAAIDGGNASGCPGTDQRGVTRPQQAACDIGAYEFGPASATTGSAATVGVTTASISGTLHPNLRASDYHFEYGPTGSYGSSTPSIGAGSGNQPLPVSAALTGLKAATTYHYRFVATNADGTTAGTDRTFTTRAFPGSTLHGRRLRADRKGRIALNLSCPGGTAGGTCASVASLYGATGKLPVKASRRTRRAKLLGRARLSTPAGQSVTRRLRLSRKGRKALRKGRATRARMVLSTRDGAGNSKTSVYRVTVRAVRR